MVRDISCYYGPGADKAVAAQGDAADYGGIGSDRGALFYQGGSGLVHLAHFSAGIVYIGKYHGWSAEHPFFQSHPFVYAHVVLYLAPVAYGHIRADHAVLADVTTRADAGVFENVGEVPDFRFFANFHIFV